MFRNVQTCSGMCRKTWNNTNSLKVSPLRVDSWTCLQWPFALGLWVKIWRPQSQNPNDLKLPLHCSLGAINLGPQKMQWFISIEVNPFRSCLTTSGRWERIWNILMHPKAWRHFPWDISPRFTMYFDMYLYMIPPGNLTYLWKSQFLIGTLTINGNFQRQCNKLPEGKSHQIPLNHHFPMVFLWILLSVSKHEEISLGTQRFGGETRQDPRLGLLQREPLWRHETGGDGQGHGSHATLCLSEPSRGMSWLMIVDYGRSR